MEGTSQIDRAKSTVSKPVIGIVDYRSGNIRSVVNAVESIGSGARVVRNVRELNDCSHMILPGVGAFGFCAQRLRDSGLLDALEQWALRDRRPLLGICVGMQLMADYSEELGRHEGLGWIGGAVRKLERKQDEVHVRVPHVGWNDVVFAESFGLFKKDESVDFYFDHSFAYCAPRLGKELACSHHGQRFSALLQHENIIAAQFHPEKSQAAGRRLLKSFLQTSDA